MLLGPAHREAVEGLAAPTCAGFETPLGVVPVSEELLFRAASLGQVVFCDDAHRREHSLEVHLPFLQVVLDQFHIVPFAVGRVSTREVAEVLKLLWGGPETLVVVSSDLSHFLTAPAARYVDRETASLIERKQYKALTPDRACGFAAIRGLLQVVDEQDMVVRTVDLRNSGDTAGSQDRVVGYGAFVVQESAVTPNRRTSSTVEALPPLNTAQRDLLLQLAQAAIRQSLSGQDRLRVRACDFPELADRHQASFVTLRRQQELRGCMGSLNWGEALAAGVVNNAFKAANRDPRFEPLAEEELIDLEIDISVLSPPAPITFTSEQELCEQLRPDIDGVILREGSRYAVFLPSVWQSLPQPEEFLQRLKQKAGLPADYWSDTLTAERFEVESIRGDAGPLGG